MGLVSQKVHIFFLPRVTLVTLTAVEIVFDLSAEEPEILNHTGKCHYKNLIISLSYK